MKEAIHQARGRVLVLFDGRASTLTDRASGGVRRVLGDVPLRGGTHRSTHPVDLRAGLGSMISASTLRQWGLPTLARCPGGSHAACESPSWAVETRGQTLRTIRAGLRRAGFATGGVAVAASVGLMTYPFWRSRCLTWGTAGDEATRTLTGDDLLAEPDLVSTRATSIGASGCDIWPWLAQMGSGRGGLYTYDWIENLFGLHMHSVDVVLPQFQNIQVGDAQQLGKQGPVLRVAVADPPSALVLRSDDGNWVWAFCLVRNGTGTRLISRNRIATPGARWPSRAFYRFVMEPGSLVMERKMLQGIKKRAEHLARESEDRITHAVRNGRP